MSSKFSNFSSSNSSMATLEKKSPVTTSRLPHQQSLPTPKHHHPLQPQLSAPLQTKNPVATAESMQVSIEQSDKSSLNSIELEQFNDCDCDRGFGSMSSGDQAQVRRQNSQKEMAMVQAAQTQQQKELDELKQEITKLKCDKLDLLRQNVVSSILTSLILLLLGAFMVSFIK